MPLHFDATRSASASADNRRAASPSRKAGRWVNARRAFSTRTGDLRRAAPSTATARTRENGCARGPCRARRPPHAVSRVAAPKGDAKFSCLQRIEKAQNVEILSTAEDGLGATKRGRGGSSLAAVFACARAIAIDTRGALKGRQGKFSCLQPIEKAQNVEMFAATEDALGATDRARRVFRSPHYLHAPAASPSPRGALKNGMRKFSCLQRIEKARNVKIFSAAEDGLGAISQTAEALRSSRICIRRGAAPPSTAKQVTGI